jgi:hypothetical protein
VVWLHGLVPRNALPRWMAIQRRLAEILAPFGADRRALDAARVFRIAGTENSRSGSLVRPTFMAAPMQQMRRWDFEELAYEILPRERAEIVSLHARRAERRAREGGPAPAQKLTAATYWEAVLTDLQKLLTVRWSGRLPPGHRDGWLFLACCAMARLAPPQVLRREFYALAQEVGCWTEGEAVSRMSSVFKRAEMAARGERVEWRGKPVDPRYRFRAATIIEWLKVTSAEMREADLRVLIDGERRRELAAERLVAHRRRHGIIERATYEANRASSARGTKETKPWAAEGMSRATWYRRQCG